MGIRMTRRERGLAATAAALLALATLGPHVGNPAGAYRFVDQRIWLGLPHVGDVLSNLGFLVAGLAGAWTLWRLPAASVTNMERAMSALFLAGLIVTSVCSAWYHLLPDEGRLVVDRSGMAIAFAGLLGLAVATRVSERAAALTGLGFLLAAPWAVHAAASGELLLWALLQFGGMAALCATAWHTPLPRALVVNWLAVVAIYSVAKLAEAGDAIVFEFTRHALSGHTLKHLVAALAAWPVIIALKEQRRVQNGGRDPARREALGFHE